jgi:TonB family protein
MVSRSARSARGARWSSIAGAVALGWIFGVSAANLRADDEAPAASSAPNAAEKILPIPLKQPVPVYPKKLQDAGVTGTVVVTFIVNAQGDVERVEAIESPHEGLSAAAIEAVKRWKYKPGMHDGHPVSVRLRQTLAFGINSIARPVAR